MSGFCVAPSDPSRILSKAGTGGFPKNEAFNEENMVDVYIIKWEKGESSRNYINMLPLHGDC